MMMFEPQYPMDSPFPLKTDKQYEEKLRINGAEGLKSGEKAPSRKIPVTQLSLQDKQIALRGNRLESE